MGRGQDLGQEIVAAWRFGSSEDKNLDRWPDGWRRRQDRQHPAYLEMALVPKDPQQYREVAAARHTLNRIWHLWETGRWDPDYTPELTPPQLQALLDRFVLDGCFEIRMNGGAAEVVSPLLPLDPRFSYRLEADLLTDSLWGQNAWVELELLDEQLRPVQLAATPRVEGTSGWKQRLATEVILSQPSVRYGQVKLHVAADRNPKLGGLARFDNIRLYRMPRLTISTSLARNIVAPGHRFQVQCDATGIHADASSVLFRLIDIDHHVLAEQEVAMQRSDSPASPQYLVHTEMSAAADVPRREAHGSTSAATDPADQQPDPMSTVSQATWEVVIPRPGLYFIDARLSSTRRLPVRGVVIAAMEMDEPVRAGPFGWSVETLDGELPAEEIPELARQVGASWLKFPIWYDMSDVRQAERLVAFVEMLDARQIRCVGVIDAPPKEYRGQFGQANGAWLVYHYLQDPEVWEPLLEPVLTRLGMKVRWFQLGGEQDTSLRIAPDLSSILADIRRRIRTYAQDAKLSFVWEWIEAPPELGDTDKIDALQLVAMPPLTAEELRNLADAVPKGTATWVFINPLPKTDYDLYTRVIDLTERMIAVKEKEVEAAFVCNPADDSRGLLTDDGDAGEMLIPWHTLASAIGTGRSEGTIALPASSQNHIFSTERDGVMVLWNSEPVEEQLYFGDNITVHDIWGRSIPYETVTTSSGASEQRVQVGRWPLIIHGINIEVVQFRQGFRLREPRIDNRGDGRAYLELEVASPFQDPVSGTVLVSSPRLIFGDAVRMPFHLMGGKSVRWSLPLPLRADATTGVHRVRFDFEIKGRQVYRFSLYRDVHLGSDDIELQFSVSRLSDDEVRLLVDVMNNTESAMSFDCKLLSPHVPYQRFQLLDLPPGSSQRELRLRIPPSAQPVTHWIRCERIRDTRTMNYRVTFQ